MITPRRKSAAFRVAEAIVRPPLAAFTRRDWRGQEHLPRDNGFIACSNHLSHVDPFTLARFLLDGGCPPRFLAKQSVFRIPVLGRLVAGAGQIPVRRRPHLLPRHLVHVWAGPPVDLSRFADRPDDVATLRAATTAIMDAVTGLLEGIRGERAPAERWDPRRYGQPLTGDLRWATSDERRRGDGSAA